ncbi:MAG: extracellular solute-binding protein [Bacillota bacterium]|nr:extracellular solute-binding protein [Bacillota bacterium]
MHRKLFVLILVIILILMQAACTGTQTTTSQTGGTTKSTTTTAATTTTATTTGGPVNQTGLPISDSELIFTAMARRSATSAEWNDMWCFRKAKEITNIGFDITSVSEDAWNERINLAFATKALPEVILSANNLQDLDLIKYGSQGLIISLADYLEDYAPLVTQRFTQYPEVIKALTSPDGNVYKLTGFGVMTRNYAQKRFWINAQWVRDLNMEKPTNLDEFYDVLMAFKTNDMNKNGDANDEIPVPGMFNTGFAIDIPILVAFGYVSSRIDTINDTVVYTPTEPLYEEYLKYFNKLYKDELVDPEYFSQTQEQFLAKGGQMRYGVMSYHADWLMVPQESDYTQYEAMPPMVSQYNQTKMWPSKVPGLYGGISVTSECRYPEAIIRYIDWIYTAEGSTIMQFGPENGTYEGGEGGWTLITNEEGIKGYQLTWPEKYSSYNEFRLQEINPMSMPYVSLPDDQPLGYYLTSLSPTQRKLTKDIDENYTPYYRPAFPTVMMTAEENEKINMIVTDLTPYVEQMEARFMTGEESFDGFDAFVQGCKDRGSDELVAIYQEVYERWKSAGSGN